jgi:hypothetical protein
MGADRSDAYLLVVADGGRSHSLVRGEVMHPIPPDNGDDRQMAW